MVVADQIPVEDLQSQDSEQAERTEPVVHRRDWLGVEVAWGLAGMAEWERRRLLAVRRRQDLRTYWQELPAELLHFVRPWQTGYWSGVAGVELGLVDSLPGPAGFQSGP